MDLQEEKKLIENAKKDPEAFEKIFEKYYSPLLHYVLKRTGNVQIAEDITSQIFFIILRKLWQFRWRNIPFSAWLYRIAHNEINYYYRKNKYKNISLEILLKNNQWEPADASDIEEEIKEAEKIVQQHKNFLLIQEKLFELPTKYQEVLTLKYLDNKKIIEISHILGKKENTVKSLLKRGLFLLQQKTHQQKLMQQFSTSLISEHEQT